MGPRPFRPMETYRYSVLLVVDCAEVVILFFEISPVSRKVSEACFWFGSSGEM